MRTGDQTMSKTKSYKLHPIGKVKRTNGSRFLEVFEPFRPALKRLGCFSHVMVFWWAHKHDNEESRSILQCRPPYAKDKETGVFATRAEYRPNPIAVSTCKILKIDEKKGVIEVGNIDAFDGTPIMDLKAYFPVCDRVKKARIADWLSDWPEWMPEDGIGL
jgi:tRNA-Thr(GGU) m(6)t(6)A37 methyltransferase TsaA